MLVVQLDLQGGDSSVVHADTVLMRSYRVLDVAAGLIHCQLGPD